MAAVADDDFLSYEELLEKTKKPPKSGIGSFHKESKDSRIWWVDTSDRDGVWLFSFDKKEVFNMFEDYPYRLTKEQKEIFDKENPFWADFFSDRNQNQG